MGLPGSRSVFTASLIGAAFVAVLLFCTSPSYAKNQVKDAAKTGQLATSKELIEKAVAFRDAGRLEQAIEAYSKVTELDPEYAAALRGRGDAYASLGDFQRAIEVFDKVIAINPNDALAYASRGFTYLRLGDFQRAIDDCGKAIEMNSKDAASYYNRGAAYANLGDYKSATEDYKVAARLGNADSQVILIISGAEW